MSIDLGPKLGLIINGTPGDQCFDQIRPFFRFVDALVMGSVINATSTAPPLSPNNGDAYLLLGTPTGAWQGEQNKIAVYSTEITASDSDTKIPGWDFWTPNPGWQVFDVSTNAPWIYESTGWTQNQNIVAPVLIQTTSPTEKGLVVKGYRVPLPSVVQTGWTAGAQGTTALTQALPHPTTAGNTLVVLIAYMNGTVAATDNLGNTYSVAYQGPTQAVLIAQNITAGATTVTVTPGQYSSVRGIFVVEVSGLTNGTVFDAANGSGSGNLAAGTYGSGPITTTGLNDLILVFMTGPATLGETAGYSSVIGDASNSHLYSTIATTAGNYSDSMTTTGTGVGGIGIVALKATTIGTQQTGDLQEWVSPAGTVLASVNGQGQIVMAQTSGLPSNQPSPGALAFDPASGVLYGYSLNGWEQIGITGTSEFNVAALSTPVVTLTTQSTGGSLAGNTTFAYRVTATPPGPVNTLGSTLPSTEVTITTGAGTSNQVTVSWQAIPGAYGYRVYGRTAGAELLIYTAPNGLVTSFIDTGSVTPAGALPTANSSGNLVVNGAWLSNVPTTSWPQLGSGPGTSALRVVSVGSTLALDAVGWNTSSPELPLTIQPNGGTTTVGGNLTITGTLVAPAYTTGNSYTSGGWFRLGTWVSYQANPQAWNPGSIGIRLYGGEGYNTALNQEQYCDITLRTGNSVQAPNLSGALLVQYSAPSYNGTTQWITGFKVVATGGSTSTANNSWDIWLQTSVFSDYTYTVTLKQGDQWIPYVLSLQSDPGAASSSVVIGTMVRGLTDTFTGNVALTGSLTASGTMQVGSIGSTQGANLMAAGNIAGQAQIGASNGPAFVNIFATTTNPSYNPAVVQGDSAIIFSSTNVANSGGCFAIMPWSTTAGGLRMDGAGNTTITGTLTVSSQIQINVINPLTASGQITLGANSTAASSVLVRGNGLSVGGTTIIGLDSASAASTWTLRMQVTTNSQANVAYPGGFRLYSEANGTNNQNRALQLRAFDSNGGETSSVWSVDGFGTMTTVNMYSTSATLSGNVAPRHYSANNTGGMSYTIGAGASQNPANATVNAFVGNDVTGTIMITTGPSPVAGGVIVGITFGTPYSGPSNPTFPYATYGPNVFISPGTLDGASTQHTAALSGSQQVWVAASNAQFVIYAGTTALAANTTYEWQWFCIQRT